MSGIPVVGSFGDIVKVLELANELRRVVGSATRATAELCEFQEDLDLFAHGLQAVQASLPPADSHGRAQALQLQQDVQHAISVCLALLTRMKRRIQEHKDGITGQFGKKAWKKYWARLAWGILGGRTEVFELRRRLMQQMTVLQLCLTAGNSIASEARQPEGVRHHAVIPPKVQVIVAPFMYCGHDRVHRGGFRFFTDGGRAVQPATVLSYEDFSRFLAGYWSVKQTRTARLLLSMLQPLQTDRIQLCASLSGETWLAYIVVPPGVLPIAAPVVLLSPVFFKLRTLGASKMARLTGSKPGALAGTSAECTRLLISSLDNIKRVGKAEATRVECLRVLHASRLFLGGEELIDIGPFARQVQRRDRAFKVVVQETLPRASPPVVRAPSFAQRVRENASKQSGCELQAPPQAGLRPRAQRSARRWVDSELAEFANMQLNVAQRNEGMFAAGGRPSDSARNASRGARVSDGFPFPTAP